jgi:hypothetical protein
LNFNKEEKEIKQGMRSGFGKVVAFSLLSLFGALALAPPSQAQTPLGKRCTTHQECVSQRCDNRPDAGAGDVVYYRE